MKRQQPFLIRLFKYLAFFKITPVGQIAVLAISLSTIGVVTIEIPIYQFFCGIVCLFGVIELTGILMRPNIEVRGWLPDRVTVGESVTGLITVRNRGWLPACDVMCAIFGLPGGLQHTDADRSIRSIARGETAKLPFTIRATRRGEYLLPELRIHSTFPFNLMRFGPANVPQLELLVVPAFEPLSSFQLPFSRKFQVGGVTAETHFGQSTEFVGNRDYVTGEPARRLDFKAWARVGRPVVREFQDEVTADVILVLDNFQSPSWKRWQGSRQLDCAVALTAAIAHSLEEQDATVAAFAAGSDLFIFQPAMSTPHNEAILQILASVEPSRYDSFLQLSEAMTGPLETAAVVICVFLTWDPVREQFVREVYDAGIGVRTMLVSGTIPNELLPDEIEITLIDPHAEHPGELIDQ